MSGDDDGNASLGESLDEPCPFCLCKINTPVYTNCGHFACLPCISRHLRTSNVCCICREWITDVMDSTTGDNIIIPTVANVSDSIIPSPQTRINRGQYGGVERYMAVREANASGTPLVDLFTTPLWVVVALILGLGTELKPDSIVFDGCEGLGHILQPFSDRGYRTSGSDKYPQVEGKPSVDYLTCDLATLLAFYDIIVMNPPFGLKCEFIRKTVVTGKRCCLLVPVETISNVGMQDFFAEHPFRIIFLSPKPSFSRPDGSSICVGVCVWLLFNFKEEVNGSSIFIQKNLFSPSKPSMRI
jgi:hypothetical protein